MSSNPLASVPIQNLRSGIKDKRPTAANLANGQIAINYHEDDPGIFFKSDQGDLIKVSPTFVGSSQPNSSPPTNGSTGNSKGETWLDTTNSGSPILKIYDGSSWVADFGYEDIDVTGAYKQTIQALSSSDIDCSLGNYFTTTVSGNTSFTFSNAPSSRVYSCMLEITHTSGTISWPASVKFAGGVPAPDLTTNKVHLFLFVTDDGGTTFRAGTLIDFTS